MRLSREQVFDLVELVGKAVSTARQRPVDASWLDEISPGWLRRLPKPEKPPEDEFGLFEGSSWQSGSPEQTDLEAVAPGAGDFGFAEPEKRQARRSQREFGDGVSRQLWDIQRQVQFKLTTVTDALDQLRRLCDSLGSLGYISKGWARSVRLVIDRCCL